MLTKLKNAVNRLLRTYDHGSSLVEEVWKTNTLATLFANQNAIMFGLSEILKRLNHFDHLRVDMQKANQLMNRTGAELSAFNDYSATLRERFDGIEKDLGSLGGFIESHKQSLAASFTDYQKMMAELEQARSRAARLVRAAGAPQAFLGALAEEDNAAEAIEQFKAEAEVMLMLHLYPFLPNGVAVDIGANKGFVTSTLLRAGYEVYAFEPFPAAYDELTARCGASPRCHPFRLAVGAADGEATLNTVKTSGEIFSKTDATLYSTLVKHDLPKGLEYSETVPVSVRSMASLHASGELPGTVDLVKIDTEGADIEVIRGMDGQAYSVVVTESWAPGSALAGAQTPNPLDVVAAEMRARGYPWLIHIFRKDGTTEPAFFTNWDRQHPQTWGNTFFFRDRELFRIAAQWCESYIPRAPISLDPAA